MNENFKTGEKIKAWVAELEEFFGRKFGSNELQMVDRTLFGNLIKLVPSMAGMKWEIYYYEQEDNPLFLMMDQHLVCSYHGCWENLKKIAEDIVLEKIVENMRIFFKNDNLGFSRDYNTYSFAHDFNLMICRDSIEIDSDRTVNGYVLKTQDSRKKQVEFYFKDQRVCFVNDDEKEYFINIGKTIVKRQEAIDYLDRSMRDSLSPFLAY